MLDFTIEGCAPRGHEAECVRPEQQVCRRGVAVELSPPVGVIGQLWESARGETVRSLTALVGGAGGTLAPVGGTPAPHGGGSTSPDTEALVAALVGMTERAFYEASRTGASLDAVAEVVATIWGRALGVASPPPAPAPGLPNV